MSLVVGQLSLALGQFLNEFGQARIVDVEASFVFPQGSVADCKASVAVAWVGRCWASSSVGLTSSLRRRRADRQWDGGVRSWIGGDY